MYRKFGKRLVDLVLSGIALIPLSVVYLILAIAIKIDDPGPVFFRQKRVGLNKTHFEIMKFRTMKMETPKDMPTHLLKNPEQYITRVGGFLRKYSLDELPQILQIFTGKMSIVGARPALWNELPIDVKARLDGEYIQKMGFFFDIKCMIGTVLPVFTGAGVVEGGTGSMEKEQ